MMKFIDTQYENSIACATVKSASKDQLKIRRPHTIAAINAHRSERNESQVKFFSKELELIDKLLKRK